VARANAVDKTTFLKLINTITKENIVMNSKISEIAEVLKTCWIKETSNQPEKWTATNPTLGQCAITSVIVNELFGGIIIRGEMKSGQTHYWNLIGNDVIDLTRDQFKYDLSFENIRQVTAEKILNNENTAKRYEILSKKLKKAMADQPISSKPVKKAKAKEEATAAI